MNETISEWTINEGYITAEFHGDGYAFRVVLSGTPRKDVLQITYTIDHNGPAAGFISFNRMATLVLAVEPDIPKEDAALLVDRLARAEGVERRLVSGTAYQIIRGRESTVFRIEMPRNEPRR